MTVAIHCAARAATPRIGRARRARRASGSLRGPEDLDRAIRERAPAGMGACGVAAALGRTGHFAGDDEARAADLNDALRDRASMASGVCAVDTARFACRPHRWSALADHVKKPILGYSDVTSLTERSSSGRIISYHAPTARTTLSSFSPRAVADGRDSRRGLLGVAERARVLRPGRATGRLEGGNLAVFTALVGTAYLPPLDGASFFRDVNERFYRIDPCSRSCGCRGRRAARGPRDDIGECTNCPEESDDGARTLDDVLLELADWLRVPVPRGGYRLGTGGSVDGAAGGDGGA